MIIPFSVIAIALVVLVLTWTKNVKPDERPMNITATVVAIIMIMGAVYFIFR